MKTFDSTEAFAPLRWTPDGDGTGGDKTGQGGDGTGTGGTGSGNKDSLGA